MEFKEQWIKKIPTQWVICIEIVPSDVKEYERVW